MTSRAAGSLTDSSREEDESSTVDQGALRELQDRQAPGGHAGDLQETSAQAAAGVVTSEGGAPKRGPGGGRAPPEPPPKQELGGKAAPRTSARGGGAG